jgi:hypothetical protein
MTSNSQSYRNNQKASTTGKLERHKKKTGMCEKPEMTEKAGPTAMIAALTVYPGGTLHLASIGDTDQIRNVNIEIV